MGHLVYMRGKIIVLMLALPVFLLGQETKQVTERNASPEYKEVYDVLKSDKLIRHGNYNKYNSNGAVQINGFYKNGQRDSIWTEYNWTGKMIISQGTYSLDKQIGLWTFYNALGEVEQKYDYTKNELVSFKLTPKEMRESFLVISGEGNFMSQLDRPPLFIGTLAIAQRTLLAKMNYPNQARDKGVSGQVRIAFTIDSIGRTSNFRAEQGIGSGCDEEALRCVQELPNNWLPGVLNGKNVNVEYIYPITFRIK